MGTSPSYTDLTGISGVLGLLVVFVITGLSVNAQRRGSTHRRREVLAHEALAAVDRLLALGPVAPDASEFPDRIREVWQCGDRLIHTLGQLAAEGEVGEARLVLELQQRALEFITVTVDGSGGPAAAHQDHEGRYGACRQRLIAARTAFASRSRGEA